MPGERASNLDYCTGVLLRIHLLLGVVVGILRTFSFNSHDSPLMCRYSNCRWGLESGGWVVKTPACSLRVESGLRLVCLRLHLCSSAHCTASSGLGEKRQGSAGVWNLAVPSPDLSRVFFFFNLESKREAPLYLFLSGGHNQMMNLTKTMCIFQQLTGSLGAVAWSIFRELSSPLHVEFQKLVEGTVGISD